MSSASWKLADALFSQQPSKKSAIRRIPFTLLSGDSTVVLTCCSTWYKLAWPAHVREVLLALPINNCSTQFGEIENCSA
jgi:hypothetical protein